MLQRSLTNIITNMVSALSMSIAGFLLAKKDFTVSMGVLYVPAGYDRLVRPCKDSVTLPNIVYSGTENFAGPSFLPRFGI